MVLHIRSKQSWLLPTNYVDNSRLLWKRLLPFPCRYPTASKCASAIDHCIINDLELEHFHRSVELGNWDLCMGREKQEIKIGSHRMFRLNFRSGVFLESYEVYAQQHWHHIKPPPLSFPPSEWDDLKYDINILLSLCRYVMNNEAGLQESISFKVMHSSPGRLIYMYLASVWYLFRTFRVDAA